MSEITHILRFGKSAITLLLDCGHKITRTADEVKLQQLFIGKRIGCEVCARNTEEGYSKQPGAAEDARRSFNTAFRRKRPNPLE